MVRVGAPLASGLHAVARFAEKPDLETAQSYLAAGDYLWNAGVFLFAPELMISEMARHRADILAAADAALEGARDGRATIVLDAAAVAACPAAALDVAVMERTARAAVASLRAGWSDVGSWDELWRMLARDQAGNAVRADALALDTRDSIIWSDGPQVGVLGLSDVVVVASGGGVLVLPRNRAQEVKALVAALQRRAGDSPA